MSVFLDWIDINKLDMRIISGHPEAVPFLEANPHLIYLKNFSMNSGAIPLLLANRDKIDFDTLGYNTAENTYLLYEGNIDKITNWMPICKNESPWINKVLDGNIEKLSNAEIIALSSNPVAIPTIEKYLHRMVKYGLVMNPRVQEGIYDANLLFKYVDNRVPDNYCSYSSFTTFLHLCTFKTPTCRWFMSAKVGSLCAFEMRKGVKYNRDKINKYICMNKDAEELIEDYLEKEDLSKIDYPDEPYWFPILSSNPAAIKFMRKNAKYIYWPNFSGMEEAIDIIRENLHLVDWDALSENRLAMDILKMNQKNINWEKMSHNIGIYIDQSRIINEKINKKNINEYKRQQWEQLYIENAVMPVIDFEKITIHYEEDLGPLFSSDSSDESDDYL